MQKCSCYYITVARGFQKIRKKYKFESGPCQVIYVNTITNTTYSLNYKIESDKVISPNILPPKQVEIDTNYLFLLQKDKL